MRDAISSGNTNHPIDQDILDKAAEWCAGPLTNTN